MNKSIPNSLLPHLNEIAARLWSGHAAIMVGAGFSRNATPINDSCRGFPDWNQLGELFYEKTRGENIKDGRFLNALKLADEVQASFGRPMLHQLLRDSIPDNEYEPSSLHVDLLNLPWSDVLTTNYDTLLERAARSVTERNYQLVVNNQNLIYSERPRIIKLHGSFPNVEPFIITEEDYRCYPNDFAPFVNTVQQSLLENTLCLIGFSGDDPNFLRWIGWIRDNLGEELSPKIYLIGVLNLTKAQASLLAKYNIVPIDMSDLEDVGSHDHYKGVQKFFEYCLGKKSESDRLDWPRNSADFSSVIHSDQTIVQKIEKILPEWKAQRENFPGWVVTPEDRRGVLWQSTKPWEGLVKKVEELPPKLLLEFLYEYFWRIEKCLCPIFDPNAVLIECVLTMGKEFIDNYKTDHNLCSNNIDFSGLNLSQVKVQCCFLQLTYLRYLREEGKFDTWKFNAERASTFLLQDADYSRYHYEKCLYFLFEFNIENLENQLQHWLTKPNQPFWCAKKAGLLAEMGKTEEAVTILEDALKMVRSHLNLRPVTSDYSSVSQEAYILVLLKHVKDCRAWSTMNFEPGPEFSDRWNILKQYKCDPWNELKLLEQPLELEYKESPQIQKKPLFDIGSSNTTLYFGEGNTYRMDAFRLLKFMEEIGVPFRVPGGTFAKAAAMEAIARLSEVVPYWCMSTMLRIGDPAAVDKIIDRRALLSMHQSDVDSLMRNYCHLFDNIVFASNSKESAQKDLFMRVIPELISRLLSKCSSNEKKVAFNLLEKIYTSNDRRSFSGVDKLMRRLVETISTSEILFYIPKLIRFPVHDSLNDKMLHNFPNPFNFMGKLREKYIQVPPGFCIDQQKVDELIQFVRKDSAYQRQWCMQILFELKRFKLLAEHQVTAFIDAAWSLVDQQGFPRDTGYYRFALCRDIPSSLTQGKELIKRYILAEEFQTQRQSSGQGIAMTGGDMHLCQEILGANEFVEWESDEIRLIFNKLLKWWDSDKGFLKKASSCSIREEFELRFNRLRMILVKVVAKNFSGDQQEDLSALNNMVKEMEEHGLPVCSIKCSFSDIVPCWKENLLSEISLSYLDEKKVFTEDSMQGMYFLIERDDESDFTTIERCLELIASSLLLRDRHRLRFSLKAAFQIVSKNIKYFRGSFKDAVLFALDKLKSETNGNVDLIALHEGLYIRDISAQLAFQIYRHCLDLGVDVPEIIYQWRAICASPDEFIEIRSAWPNLQLKDS
jgi:hypothetical protein